MLSRYSVVLNSAHPDSADAQALRASLESKYDVPVTLLNVKEMNQGDIQALLSSLLMEFPLREVRFQVPSWLGALEKISDDGFYREATEGLRDYCLRNCMATEPVRRQLAFLQGGGAK